MVSIIIPTYNAEKFLPPLLNALNDQNIEKEIILIDSESTDATRKIAAKAGIQVISIKKSEFNHGSTRNIGIREARYDTLVYLTQDALPVHATTISTLVNMLHSREDIVMAYGRQIPYPETGVFGRSARLTNYPAQSIIKNKELISAMGIRTCSCSNSYAAYRKSDLAAIGGFPSDILGEEVTVAAQFILQGKALAYCAESEVLHSHDYTVVEEFKRYFDIGVFHASQRSLLKEFTKAESEGFKYVIQEWRYLAQTGHIALIPAQLIRTVAKYIGYKMGILQDKLPLALKRHISMHPGFWASYPPV